MNADLPRDLHGARADVAARVAATIRPDIRACRAYAVAKAGDMIKLDAMESPYALPDAVGRLLAETLARVPINRYPDGAAEALKASLRSAFEIPEAAGVIVGNGSDELIQIVTAAVAAPGACVLAPEPSFVMYRMNALFAHARFAAVPLRADFSLDVDAMLAAVARERPALTWLAYPNNPTGNRFSRRDVERVIEASPGLVVVDEAYYAYADDSFLPRVLDHPNLVVVRTVSKVGMAGVRLGYAAGHRAWTDELDKVRPPYNVNAFTQAAVPLLLERAPMLAGHARAILAERARLAAALRECDGVRVFDTETNFVLVRVADAGRWFAALRDAGILIKNLDGWHPLLANCLRITVGTPADSDALIAVFRSLDR